MSKYFVEVTDWSKEGSNEKVKIPCTLVRENDTSFRVRVTFPHGETRIIRKKKDKILDENGKSYLQIMQEIDEKSRKEKEAAQEKKKTKGKGKRT